MTTLSTKTIKEFLQVRQACKNLKGKHYDRMPEFQKVQNSLLAWYISNGFLKTDCIMVGEYNVIITKHDNKNGSPKLRVSEYTPTEYRQYKLKDGLCVQFI